MDITIQTSRERFLRLRFEQISFKDASSKLTEIEIMIDERKRVELLAIRLKLMDSFRIVFCMS